jgi:hypothetical protein
VESQSEVVVVVVVVVATGMETQIINQSCLIYVVTIDDDSEEIVLHLGRRLLLSK